MGTDGYQWVPVGTGGYWRVSVGTGDRWLSLSITLLQIYIFTNLDCYKPTDFQFIENSRPKNTNWEGVLYEDSVKDLLKIC